MAQFTNQAQLSYGDSVTNSNIAVGEILEVLSATKTAVRNTYGQNDSVTYIINVVNAGSMPYTGLTIRDNLGEYDFGTSTRTPLSYVAGTLHYFVNGIPQPTPTVTAGVPLVITGIQVPPGGNAMIVYEAEVNQFAPLAMDSTITNQAVISGNGVTSIIVEETVEAESEPLLTITKSISPVPVAENGTLTYTFLIQNSGSEAVVATTDAVVTDLFNPILSNLAVTFNGATWEEEENYTYNEDTGLFETNPGQITVPAATYTQDPTTGVWVTNPGVSVLVVSGTV